MAKQQAIVTVCNAILHLLSRESKQQDFNTELTFKVYLANDFSSKPITSGVSLFLYRIFANGSHRTPSGRIDKNGSQYRTQLPLDLHFFLTPWGKDSSLQLSIAGWMMRTLEDNPILPFALLDAVAHGAFYPDETVEVSLVELRTEDLLRIWETVTDNAFHLSVPYVARNVRIESSHLLTTGKPVQKRTFDYRVSEGNGETG